MQRRWDTGPFVFVVLLLGLKCNYKVFLHPIRRAGPELKHPLIMFSTVYGERRTGGGYNPQ